jgi:hypothetical protein
MKHIKTHKLFESTEREEDIKDICLELEDEGFNIEYNNVLDPVKSIGINVPYREGAGVISEFFDYDQVKEVVDRIVLYLGDKFVGLYIVDHNHQLARILVDISGHFTCGFGKKPNRVNWVIIKYRDI